VIPFLLQELLQFYIWDNDTCVLLCYLLKKLRSRSFAWKRIQPFEGVCERRSHGATLSTKITESVPLSPQNCVYSSTPEGQEKGAI
jgi:hypothetical protein